MRADKRIQEIRFQVQLERDLVCKLEATLIDEHLKDRLKCASHFLDDVDNVFLNAEILQEPRTPLALAKWLSNADDALTLAIRHRKSVDGSVCKYRSHAEAFSVGN